MFGCQKLSGDTEFVRLKRKVFILSIIHWIFLVTSMALQLGKSESTWFIRSWLTLMSCFNLVCTGFTDLPLDKDDGIDLAKICGIELLNLLAIYQSRGKVRGSNIYQSWATSRVGRYPENPAGGICPKTRPGFSGKWSAGGILPNPHNRTGILKILRVESTQKTRLGFSG